jgi:hypothetical protein
VIVSTAGTGHSHQLVERALERVIPAEHIVCRVPTFMAGFGLRPSQLNIARTRNEEENRTEEGSCKAGQGQRQALSGALR